MITVNHSLNFATDFDESHPTARMLLSLPKEEQVILLQGMLKSLLVPALTPAIDELNKDNTFATLRVVA
jgi:hypothetical protein